MEEEQNRNGKSDPESSEGVLSVLLKVFLYLIALPAALIFAVKWIFNV